MQIEGSTLLITGANRGIGRALVDAALSRGAARVYAGTRVPFEHSDERVVALQIDVTDARQVAAAAARVEQLDILINNAGIAQYDDLSDPTALETHLAVNLYGTYCVSQAFLPALGQAGGALVNNVSMMALAPFPVTPAYAVSKAAAFNLTQSLRGLLAPRGIGSTRCWTGPTDTDMTRGFEIPKATPESVAEAILDGIEASEEEIFPDQLSAELADSWRNGPAKAFEHQFAMAVAA
jgi:NAD(P)-dependent dehydrogenase (short-subunit alcohol dehydrogenase family)